ncbi:hypothetical protein IFR05_004439 [Cadophora sp. M221]|nr:hypothetical protein IFR05_004439 [Cadophora sp. M221]
MVETTGAQASGTEEAPEASTSSIQAVVDDFRAPIAPMFTSVLPVTIFPGETLLLSLERLWSSPSFPSQRKSRLLSLLPHSKFNTFFQYVP